MSTGVSRVDSGVAYIFAIVLVVLVINVFIIRAQFRRGNRAVRRRRSDRAVLGEPEQAIWRDKEVLRRIEREQDGAYERVKLKNETLALYDEVKRRHAKEDELERFSLNMPDDERDAYELFKRDEEPAHIEVDAALHEADEEEDRVTMIPFEDDL
jgi:flagellar biosynthesis/type III secretory pathway M-ring protein FliF/YscJ